MNMLRLKIRSFLTSCEIENIISVGVERAVKPKGSKKDLSQFMNGIIHPDRPNQCPVFFQSYTFMELRDIPGAQVRIVSHNREPQYFIADPGGRVMLEATEGHAPGWEAGL